MRRIVYSMDALEANKNLEQILEGAARPLRAVAFEREPAADAVKKHPELEGAYRTLTAATKFADSLEPADRAKFVDQTRATIQSTLNAGKLVPEPPMKKKERKEDRERGRPASWPWPGSRSHRSRKACESPKWKRKPVAGKRFWSLTKVLSYYWSIKFGQSWICPCLLTMVPTRCPESGRCVSIGNPTLGDSLLN